MAQRRAVGCVDHNCPEQAKRDEVSIVRTDTFSSSGLSSDNSAYASYGFVDNSVQGGNNGIRAMAEQEDTTTSTLFMGRHGAASDFVVSGNTFNLASAGFEPTVTRIMPARNVMFAGNQVISAFRGVHPAAAWNSVSAHDFTPYICKLTVMCNDFTGVAALPVFDQGNFPLIDSLKVYANKMGGSQTVQLEASYKDKTVTSFSGTKSKVAIVGNFYSGNPYSLVSPLNGDDPLHPGDPNYGSAYRSISITDLAGSTLSLTPVVSLPYNAAAIFSDTFVWSLY